MAAFMDSLLIAALTRPATCCIPKTCGTVKKPTASQSRTGFNALLTLTRELRPR